MSSGKLDGVPEAAGGRALRIVVCGRADHGAPGAVDEGVGCGNGRMERGDFGVSA